ncbi:MAG: DUF4398 domain-containing protein [Polyangiaceae bacterium]
MGAGKRAVRLVLAASLLAGVASAAGTIGCGGTLYAVSANSAQSRLEQARALGAEKYAPYEYWYAHEHLQKAMEEAAAADYGDAIDFADAAEVYAEKAIVLSKQAHEGAGR